MTKDKARDRAESGDSGRGRNAVIRPQEPAADRMDFFNGLLSRPNHDKRHVRDIGSRRTRHHQIAQRFEEVIRVVVL